MIYRCAYGDDDLWSRMMGNIRAETRKGLEHCGRVELLEHLISWTVVEDREALEGATVRQVRELFRKWSHSASDERDGPGASEAAFLCPRYNFCIMIDQKCLDSLAVREKRTAEAKAAGKQHWFPRAELPVFARYIRIEKPWPAGLAIEKARKHWIWCLVTNRMVDLGGQENLDDQRGDEAQDDPGAADAIDDYDEREDKDWMYVSTYMLFEVYDEFHSQSLYEDLYVRPPQIYGGGKVK